MKEQATLRIAAYSGNNTRFATTDSRLKTLVQTERLTIQGAGVHHIWYSQDGAQFIMLGEVIGLRRADGSLSHPSMLKLETEQIESPQGLLAIEGRFLIVKVLRDGSCEIWTDRFGRIDVYWQFIDGGVIVGTGIDHLPLAKSGAPLSTVGVAHSLTIYGNRPAKKHTLYAGVNRLGVDQGMRIANGTVELLTRKFIPNPTASYGKHQRDQYADILLEAIRARASTDCNVVSLSSGWDSTAILACLVHLFGNSKVRAVIGRMRYANRSGVVNQFEIDRAQAFADYYGVRLDVCDLSYCTNGPELLEKAKPLFQSQQFSNLSGLSQWVIADFVAQTANGDEVIFNGEMSDGAHNLGFSQFVTIFHPSSQDFREYSDKMASYLFGPTFMRQLLEKKHGQDPVWQLFRQRAGETLFDEPANDPVQCAKQLLSSFFLRGGRLPLYSLNNSKLLTEIGRIAYAKEMEASYLDETAALVTPETLYAWYLHLYNSFHWQCATVISRVHAALAHGLRSAMPFSDSRLIEFLSAMPESWGRGLDLKSTKYPLKWMLKHRIDYPTHLQVGPHSYLYDVDPSFSHMGEILFGSSFTPVFKDALASRKFQARLDKDAFNHEYIDQVIRRYIGNEEFRGSEMNDLGVLAMHAAVGCYGM
jgi:hypothetical protein